MQASAIEQLLMPAVYVQHLTREFPDPVRLLAGTRLRIAELERPASRITVRDDLRCVANAQALAQEPGWYQEWGTRIAEHFHGPLTPAWLSAPTLGDGLDAFLRYFPSRIPYMEFRSRTQGDFIAIELRPLIDVGQLLPILVEIPLLILQKYIGTIRNSCMREAAVELNYEAPAHLRSYQRWFECPTRFHCPRNALVIPAAWRNTRNLGYDESIWQSALHKCAESGGPEAPRNIVHFLRAELYSAFDDANGGCALPTLEAVAAKLHVSPRTLIRRLRGMGTTFYDQRDELRQIRARELVEAGALSIGQIAAVLKFSDPPNFGKAFKRWFGESPSQFRKRRN